MSFFSRISIKSKLLLMLLGVSLTSVLVIGFLALRTAEATLQQSIKAQLTSIRTIRTSQVETYFQSFIGLTRTLADSAGVVSATNNFILAYQEGAEQQLTEEQYAQLGAYYDEEYLPRLAETMTEKPLSILYRPRTPAANYFQYHYLVNNPYPYEEKSELVLAVEDSTTYRRVHEATHPQFLRMRDEFGFGDLYLIDIVSGNIVYSVGKAPDFGTNLYEGPYRSSGLGILAARIRDEPKRGVLQSIDYRPYPPALNAPTGFFAIPIYSNNEAVGILAIQIPITQINELMTGGGDWREDGLGQTGETYIVGPDKLMRSVSRFYVEDKEAYLEQALARGANQSAVDAMDRYSTVLLQQVDTDATTAALAGEEGIGLLTDYRGVNVLSSYAPLTLGGQPWAIIAQVDQTEAYQPIRDLQRTILIWTVGLMLAIAFLAILLAQVFVRPIDRLIAAAKRIAAGDDNVRVQVTTEDEFGDLSRNFNNMSDSIQRQKAAIEEQNAENKRLLLNILPAPVAARLQAGERVADHLQQVSVVFIHLLGLSKLSERWSAAESAHLLEQLIDRLDAAADRYGVERVKTFGETYVAACGLTTARLDHAAQVVDFSIEALRIVHQLNREHDIQLALQIGVNSGPVISGVVGTARFNYELWGETVEVARRLHDEAEPNGLLITQSVYQRVDRQERFGRQEVIPSVGHELIVYPYRRAEIAATPDDAEGESQ